MTSLVFLSLVGGGTAFLIFDWGLPHRAMSRARRDATQAARLAHGAAVLLASCTGPAISIWGLAPLRGERHLGQGLLASSLAVLFACTAHDCWRLRVPYRLIRTLLALCAATSFLWVDPWWAGIAAGTAVGIFWLTCWHVSRQLGAVDVFAGAATASLFGPLVFIYLTWLGISLGLLGAIGSVRGTLRTRIPVFPAFAMATFCTVFLARVYPYGRYSPAFALPRLTPLDWIPLFQALIATVMLSIIAIVDARTHHVPDRLVYPAFLVCVALMVPSHELIQLRLVLLLLTVLAPLLYQFSKPTHRFPGGDMKVMLLLVAGYGPLFFIPYLAGCAMRFVQHRSLFGYAPATPYVAAGLLIGFPVLLALSAGGIAAL